jgi:glycosidase
MHRKIIIYQALPRLFGNMVENQIFSGTKEQNGVGKFNDFSDKALREIAALGVTHVWYTGVMAHAAGDRFPEVVKGRAGSPYAITDYYDVDADLAVHPKRRMDEFEALVHRTHKAGMQVLLDFVPNHVARTYGSTAKPKGVKDFGEEDDTTKHFSPENDFYYLDSDFVVPEGIQPFGTPFDRTQVRYTEHPAKATGNDCFTPYPSVYDWYETVKLNYGIDYAGGGVQHFSPVPDVWKKMLDILLFWAEKKIDGFRCDMAEMVPLAFWAWALPQVKARYPEIIFIAETYHPEEYYNYIFNGKFDYLYDKVGLYDTMRAVMCHGLPASAITNCWQRVEGIGDSMLRFVENHDEQRVASSFFAGDARKALPAMLVSAAMNQGPVMIYAGQEVGEKAEGATGFSGDDGRTSIFDYTSVPALRQWNNGGRFDGQLLSDAQKQLRADYQQLLNVVGTSNTVAKGAFYDLMWANTGRPFIDRCYLFLRYTNTETLLFVCYFDAPDAKLHIHIPAHAFEMMYLPSGRGYVLTPLLHGADTVELSTDNELTVTMKNFGYEIYRFSEK